MSIDKIISQLENDRKYYGWNDGTLASQIEANRNKILEALQRNAELIEQGGFNKSNVVDTQETIILKELGYEGIDVRGIKVNEGNANPDSAGFGSVIFDPKERPIRVIDAQGNKIEANNKTIQNEIVQQRQQQ